ncbi:MAG: NAD(P)/FAD-dependent oxidoreductase [Acidimicrobiales bacterium]
MPTADVAVVGAGPAGAGSALHLARAGLDVVLVDRARFPRDKCCGDGLTTSALRQLDALGLDPAGLPSWRAVGDVVLRGPAGHAVRLPLPAGRGVYAAVVPRIELDAALVDLARSAGVRVVEGHPCQGASVRGDRIELEVGGWGRVAARYAVGADGAWSPLRKRLTGRRRDGLGEMHALRQYFSGVGVAAGSALHVWFEPELAPGYAWSFPLAGGRANVGFGIQRGGRLPTGAMTALWPDLLGRAHIGEVLGPDSVAQAPHRAWPIPARIGSVALTGGGGRALFVGDAAAACDPLTGEGIGQALLTAELAAHAIVAAGPLDPVRAAIGYQVAVGRELRPDAVVSRLLAGVIRHRRGIRISLRMAGSTAWTRRNFARWLFEDYPRAYLATPRRWRGHSLGGDGAWPPAGS